MDNFCVAHRLEYLVHNLQGSIWCGKFRAMSDLTQNQQNSPVGDEPKKRKSNPNRGGARPNAGGARPGAGRPRGVQDLRNAEVAKALTEYKVTPLSFMMGILNDENSAFDDKKWAANAAAPYMHARISQVNATTDNKHTLSTEEAARITKDLVDLMGGV